MQFVAIAEMVRWGDFSRDGEFDHGVFEFVP